jgi:hypothetical protein
MCFETSTYLSHPQPGYIYFHNHWFDVAGGKAPSGGQKYNARQVIAVRTIAHFGQPTHSRSPLELHGAWLPTWAAVRATTAALATATEEDSAMGQIYGSVPARRGFEAANAALNVFNSLSTGVNCVC